MVKVIHSRPLPVCNIGYGMSIVANFSIKKKSISALGHGYYKLILNQFSIHGVCYKAKHTELGKALTECKTTCCYAPCLAWY